MQTLLNKLFNVCVFVFWNMIGYKVNTQAGKTEILRMRTVTKCFTPLFLLVFSIAHDRDNRSKSCS